MRHSFSLSDDQIAAFNRDGYLGPFPAFADEAACDKLYDFFFNMADNALGHPLYNRYSVRDWHLLEEDALRLLTHPAIADPLHSLSQEPQILWRSKVFHKRPGDGEIGWHQEWGFFNGEEIGNDKPSLISPRSIEHHWDWTVWIALHDITPENGPLQFVTGSHHQRYPIEMVPMQDSGIYHDPFLEGITREEVITRALDNSLILDIQTNHFFENDDPREMDFETLKSFINNRIAQKKAAVTLPFEAPEKDLRLMTMKKGEFVIFTERCMHRSLPNVSDGHRIALNARYCLADTLVYPGRLNGDFIDGSNLNISEHRCVQLVPGEGHPDNAYLEESAVGV